jgi:hypothetical protein
MQIVAKRRYQFNDYEYSIHPRNGEVIATLQHSFHVTPSLRPQIAPDWIVNDDLFDMGVADGSIVTVGDVPAKTVRPTLAVQQQEMSEEKQRELDSMLATPVSELIATPAPGVWPTRPDGFPRPSDAQ